MRPEAVAQDSVTAIRQEQTFFPTALRVLQPTDWADIALKLADRGDPLNGPDLEQKFGMLRRKILEMEAPTVVYVSCNTATQARDLNILDEKYAVTRIQPVDMFPHTHHIENVVQLRRKS